MGRVLNFLSERSFSTSDRKVANRSLSLKPDSCGLKAALPRKTSPASIKATILHLL
ncbi:MAG: hypothetical protein ACFFD1_02630 [Candidatus Thorarchaeota archaeon]